MLESIAPIFFIFLMISGLLSYYYILPTYLFKKHIDPEIIGTLKANGYKLNQWKKGKFEIKGKHNGHTVAIDLWKENGIIFFLRISVVYKVDSSPEEHRSYVEKLNSKLRNSGTPTNPNSYWVADQLNLAWNMKYFGFNYEVLVSKIEELINMVNEEGFNPLQSEIQSIEFGKKWDEAMIS